MGGLAPSAPWRWSWSVARAVFLASLLVLASAQQQPRPPRAPEMSAVDVDAILARVCGGGSSRQAAPVPPLPLCHELMRHRGGVRRHHRRPAPPPGRDEEVDLRYGVAKRLVPTGPNPLHN
ncbi:uncharacterized protein [Oryza sativa Japonica Group]|jgi:hypothetical protein|uniref:CLE family OsCLE508 protein n=7 Tax=Oryza TaxID=4527 RepID=A8R3Q5_ORYSJ|nr:uncharacterized protein LOC107278630 [Oryza sativa Japonica Group]XP_052156898.1 uncharacterized protein LOC127774659 [Oryza glaberrima]EAY98670.1 hypothetical protein OsI_20597 [Oryza sativa Indica Group]KAB8100150.1 hypothetical protein EE612_030581 [Oryza sativa]KAF2931603.1 hypothetical protein DAI22_05g224100 [Oryza sativa Japonica Group]BAF91630.1 CLE family OsCLE508 protein [Oryza sativa Japonica Group]BAS94851.1 Os05g0512301 [Oryza sativa Japonica Group]